MFGPYFTKMGTIFMNTENSKTYKPHRFKLDLADKRNLKNLNKDVAYNLSTKKVVDKDKNGEIVPKFESVEVEI